jgi:hypothetical protein
MTAPRPERSRAQVLMLLLVLLLNGCFTSRAVPVGRYQSIDPPLKTFALAPNGGIFADFIGIALSEQGYTIVDTGATLALLVLMQRTQDDLLSPEVMSQLEARGMDAVLVVQKVDGEDGLPQTVHVRLHSTVQKADVGGVTWKNGWIRRGMLESTQEIAAALRKDSQPSDTVNNDEQGSGFSSSGSE